MRQLASMVDNQKVFLSEIRKARKEKRITDYELYSLIAQIRIEDRVGWLYDELREIEQHGLYNLSANIRIEKDD